MNDYRTSATLHRFVCVAMCRQLSMLTMLRNWHLQNIWYLKLLSKYIKILLVFAEYIEAVTCSLQYKYHFHTNELTISAKFYVSNA